MNLIIEGGLSQVLGRVTPVSVLVRLLLAAICGAIVGMEREKHGRAAGLRTHMMVAIGAALTTLLGMFNVEIMHITWADPLRVGAQVISGIGFLGAGTILLKKGNSQITGLTTAAGLWVTAVIGLAVGAGFYEGGVMTAVLAVLIFTVIGKVELLMNSKRQKLFVYLELDSVDCVREMITMLHGEFKAKEVHVTPSRSGIVNNVGMEALISIPKKGSIDEKMKKIEEINHVIFALPL